MEKTSKILALTCVFCSFFYLSCGDDNKNDVPSDGSQPVIENLAVNPVSVSYSNTVVLTGNFSDQKGLQSYTIKLSNAEGNIYETTKMLTGKTFALNDNLVIVLPKNAKAGNVTISLTLKNSDGGSITEELVLQNVKIPVFEQLYLLLGTKVCLLEKIENVFVYEDIIPANATGKIYVNSDKTGMFWGRQSGNAETMANEDFVIGKGTETSLRVTFNPITFELLIEEAERWVEINEPLYILGDISGHAWETGEIVTEGSSTKMQGYQSGNKKYWTWTPPSLGDDTPNDWWGNMTANPFRFKKGGVEQYILYRNHTISFENGDDKSASFATSVGGHVTIKVFFDGTNYNKVSIEEIDWEGNIKRTLDYLPNGALNINGSPVSTVLTFAGSPLSLKEGTPYIFEGKVNLTKDQSITALGVNLSTANPDPDVFSGKGNTTWKMIGNAGEWLIRVDPFASTLYACLLSGYPDAIFMDGWSWAKFEGDPGNVWIPENRLTLQRKSADKFIYEATFHYRGWEGDINFWYAPYTDPDIMKKRFLLKNFDEITTSKTLTNMTIPGVGSGEYNGYFKVSVDLKDGFTFDTESDEAGPDGPVFVLTPANGKKFTVTFTPQ